MLLLISRVASVWRSRWGETGTPACWPHCASRRRIVRSKGERPCNTNRWSFSGKYRTRLFQLLAVHQDWTDRFLVEPALLGVADIYGLELLHPMRKGCSPQQIGQKGMSNHRWIVGDKLAFVLNHVRLVVDWDCDTANVYDATFQPAD